MVDEEKGYKTRTYLEKDAPHLVDTKAKLDKIGCGMCLAKWTQVTVHLQNGHTHSCHHPKTHKVSLTEIKRNPSALHNTRYKKMRRKEMLVDNKRPDECTYCWNVEDSSDRYSDRTFKSSETWSLPYYDEIKNSNWRDNFNPKYVEVSFSNACNFKCSYCGPAFSSTWMEEIDKHGGYPTTTDGGRGFNNLAGLADEDKMPIPHRELNPYVEAFWKWWPDLYNDLHTFRITGGEPLLSKDTFDILDYIIEHPNPNKNLGLSINSNLGGPPQLIDKFLEKMKRIEDEERIKEFIIFTSVDTWGKHAEYVRNGLDFNYFWDNCNKVLSTLKRCNLTFMSTYNALSVPNYDKLIEGVYTLKKEYGSPDRYWNSATFLDSSYLRYPQHQTVQILPMEWSNEIFKQAQFADFLAIPIFEHMHIGYSDIEIQKIKRIYDWMVSRNDDEDLNRNRRDFGMFFKEHDKRRGTDFCNVFPELADFYHKCLEIKL
jgi:organic radical activating enzyme